MNNVWVKYGLNFILIVLIQALVVNNIDIDELLNPMIYPLMVILLPFEIGAIPTMIFALVLGISVDAFSNTFGLHTSSSLLIGYFRPVVLKYVKPRDDYDNTLLPTPQDMGLLWFLAFSGILLFMHHLWFFTFEILRFDLILLLLGKTILSLFFSICLILIFVYIFYKPSKKV